MVVIDFILIFKWFVYFVSQIGETSFIFTQQLKIQIFIKNISNPQAIL